MTVSEEVQTFAGRLETFKVTHQLAKRRASSARKKGATTVQWPHTSPDPEELARAGFFYKPTADSNDNVMCFVCERNLDGWEPSDNPVVEHFAHGKDCAWAVSCYVGQSGVEEDPMSAELLAMRKETFTTRWPHKGKRGWKCTINKLAEAGWCYNPTPEYDDYTTCFYCDLSLDGWEPKDDPWVEHHKRAETCDFFRLADEHAATRKARPKKPRGSTASKASRLSVQSTISVPEVSSFISAVEMPAAEDDSIMTTDSVATTTSTTGKGRKGAARPKAAAKSTRTTTRTRKKDAKVEDSEMVDPVPHPEEAPVESTPPKRSTRSKPSQQDVSQSDVTVVELKPKRAPRGKKASQKQEKRVSEDEPQNHDEFIAAIDASEFDEHPLELKRGTKRTSDGSAKLESSAIVDPPELERETKRTSDDAAKLESSAFIVDPPEEPTAPKRARPTKAKKTKKEIAAVEPEPDVAAPAKATRKRANTKTRAPKAKEPEPEPETPEPEPDPEPGFVELEEPADAIPEFPQPPRQQTPIASSHESEEPLSSPTPLQPRLTTTPRRATGIASSSIQRHPPSTGPQHASTPSPQSSDAENVPPSSRPPTHRLSQPRFSNPNRSPLADATPSIHEAQNQMNITAASSAHPTPIIAAAPSPTKGPSTPPPQLSPVKSAWRPADLESLFVLSPATKSTLPSHLRHLLPSGVSPAPGTSGSESNKENQQNVGQLLRRIRKGLSEEEKAMTVEQWVAYNAARGEERLRWECERLVGLFEQEGRRAVEVMESMETV